MLQQFPHLRLKRPLLFLDLETTGTDVTTDRIVEIGIVCFSHGKEPSVFELRLNPGIPIPLAATAVHGICDEDVAGCASFADVAKHLFVIFEAGDLAGYNIKKFDLPLLIAEFARCGRDFSVTGRRIIDVLQIFYEQEPRDLAGAMRFYCGRDHSESHSARHDAVAAAEVLDAQLARYPDLPHTVGELHDRFATPDLQGRFRCEDGELIFNFGKHRGRPLREIAAEDPGYLVWMLGQDDFLDDVKGILSKALAET
jgi:DNA polymerase III subunit epsilon